MRFFPKTSTRNAVTRGAVINFEGERIWIKTVFGNYSPNKSIHPTFPQYARFRTFARSECRYSQWVFSSSSFAVLNAVCAMRKTLFSVRLIQLRSVRINNATSDILYPQLF